MLWPVHCVQGEWGSQFCDELVVLESDIIINKGVSIHHRHLHFKCVASAATSEFLLDPARIYSGDPHVGVIHIDVLTH